VQVKSWAVPDVNPLSNRTNCLAYATLTNKQPHPLYSDNPIYRRDALGRELVRTRAERLAELNDFLLIHKRYAMINEAGAVSSKCGYFLPLEGCETRFKFVGQRWFDACSKGLLKYGIDWTAFITSPSFEDYVTNSSHPHDERLTSNVWQSLCISKYMMDIIKSKNKVYKWKRFYSHYQTGIPFHKRVMVMTAAWDNNYHHFLFDLLTRIVRFLPFLQSNPDVLIHTRAFESNLRPKDNNFERSHQLRQRIMTLFGLDPNRLIFGMVKAEEVYIPRAMYCNQVNTNALELRYD
jgi:hypothetical protein